MHKTYFHYIYKEAGQCLQDLGYKVSLVKDSEGNILELDVECSPILCHEKAEHLKDVLPANWIVTPFASLGMITLKIKTLVQFQLEHYRKRIKESKDIAEKAWLREQLHNLKRAAA